MPMVGMWEIILISAGCLFAVFPLLAFVGLYLLWRRVRQLEEEVKGWRARQGREEG